MGESFKRFISKANKARLIKTVSAASASGMTVSGVLLILIKREIIALLPLYAALFGLLAAAIGFCLFFLLTKVSERSVAKRLDRELGLAERAQTMVAYRDVGGAMTALQREDAERVLGEHSDKEFKIRDLWIYIAALLLGIACLTVGLIIKKAEWQEPPEDIPPFKISDMQVAGLEELIDYVSASKMDEPYKTVISNELGVLLAALRDADTEPKMQAALASSLTVIAEATYDSSSATEILNAMWATENVHLKALALALDTSGWTENEALSWGEFMESYKAFSATFDFRETAESENITDAELIQRIKWALEDTSMKADSALNSSGIDKGDVLAAAIIKLISAEGGELSGFRVIYAASAGKIYDILREEVGNTVDLMADELYSAISQLKTNANVGEYVQKKLASLFAVVIPEFERPTLKETGGSGDNNDDSQQGSGGGVGEGATFGSDDLVLDPVTGKYVTYGTLYATYNTLMIEKLNSNRYAYTDEQIKAIEKYFALLYSGLEKD